MEGIDNGNREFKPKNGKFKGEKIRIYTTSRAEKPGQSRNRRSPVQYTRETFNQVKTGRKEDRYRYFSGERY